LAEFAALLVVRLVLQIKPDWKLEIKLYRAALVWSLEGIVDLDVDLRPIESSIARVQLPWLSKLVESLF